MDIKQLRSQLCHAIPELSTSLTESDLIELKWPTVKRIFALLIEQHEGVELGEKRIALAALLFERNAVLGERRNGTGRRQNTKEQRSDEDSAFRSAFFRIVVDALTLLHWPPAMEAFSDPLGALLCDNSTMISAVAHILQRGGRQQNVVQNHPTIITGTPSRDENIQTNRNRSNERRRPINVDCAATAPRSPASMQLDKLRDEVATFSPTVDLSSSSDVSKPPVESLRYALYIAQHQNEVLSRSLKQVQEAVCAREDAESHMSILLGELKLTVDEIVRLGNGKQTTYRHPNTRAGSVINEGGTDGNNKMLTDDLLFEFQREVEREQKLERDRRDGKEFTQIGITLSASSSSSFAKPTFGHKPAADSQVTPASPSFGSSVLWTKLHDRIGAIHQQWVEARGDARRAVVQAAELLPPQHLGNEYSYVKNRSPGGDERSSSGSRKGSNGTTSVSQSSRLRLHQIFGVQLPLSMTQVGGDEVCSVHHALDLPRIHLLQRDLVEFSNAAFTLCSESSKTTTTEKPPNKNPVVHKPVVFDPFPVDETSRMTQVALLRLHDKAQDLLLHLSCLAPIVPLATPAPWTSSMTGIDILEKEVAQASEKLGGKRSAAAMELRLRMQAACDRARSEQVALMRALQACQHVLRQWPEAVHRLSPLLDTLGKNVRDTLSRASSEIHHRSNAAYAVHTALVAAETSRAEGERSPLDGLARGKMGMEVAALISSLRLHSYEIGSTAQCLNDLRKQIARDIEREIFTFEQAKKSVLTAAESCTSQCSSIEKSLVTATVGGGRHGGETEHAKPKRNQKEKLFPRNSFSAESNPDWTF